MLELSVKDIFASSTLQYEQCYFGLQFNLLVYKKEIQISFLDYDIVIYYKNGRYLVREIDGKIVGLGADRFSPIQIASELLIFRLIAEKRIRDVATILSINYCLARYLYIAFKCNSEYNYANDELGMRLIHLPTNTIIYFTDKYNDLSIGEIVQKNIAGEMKLTPIN